MTMILLVFVGLLLLVTWLGLVVRLIERAMDVETWPAGAAAVVAFCLPLAIAIGLALGADDPHARDLCRAGHEEWQRINTGKSYVDEKVWICTAWETR